MSVYKRGKVFWYKFRFGGKLIRESAKTHSKTLAKAAEKRRLRGLEEGFNDVLPESRNGRIRTLAEVANDYLVGYTARNAPSSASYSKYCIKHLKEHLGSKMLIEITDRAVLDYQVARINEGAAGKTINEEVGELFRIMGETGETIQLKLRRSKKLKLKERQDVGRALQQDEEERLLEAAKNSQSPLIYPAIVVSLNTGLRDSEMRNLTWGQVDLFKKILTVGKSKTDEGAGRTVPINTELHRVLVEYRRWYEDTVAPVRNACYVFPWGAYKRYDPSKPVTSFKKGWNTAKKSANVEIRLHDLRHTLITKLAESGAGDETIMAIAGHVNRRMLRRYAHIRTEAKRRALDAILVQPGRLEAL